ncbi:glycosyl transferase family A [Campylobacter sp. MIT 99-7217]|uniref:glycosyltransferase family 2 protein n=1 Tax=Campylobacter sp. MIT 99-7217 TaxID=535091 RepID=UPI00115B395B|nr:glycosyltransferase family A protein [Campylobacter sp. MIT 99-7217]TQR33741.1 glycosyl transferase family A [Campylobacter sp. MIT 99-7217]
MQNPLVSIIIPIFNVKNYLKECLESVINQSYKNLDIILVDDGSEDESLELCLEYAKKDKRIFVISKPNGGLSSARNTGLEFIKGTALRSFFEDFANSSTNVGISSFTKTLSFDESVKILSPNEINKHFKLKASNFIQSDLENINDFIIQELPKRIIHFVDSDDYLKLDCIEFCVRQMQREKLEICMHEWIEFHESNQQFITNQTKLKNKQSLFDKGLDFLIKNRFYDFFFAWQGSFQSEILNRYKLRFTHGIYHEDHDFGTLLFCLALRILKSDYKGYIYRIRANSITTSQNDDTFPQKLPKFLEPLKPYFTSYKDLREYFRTYGNVIIAYNIYNFSKTQNNSRKEKKFFKKCIFRYSYDYIFNFSHFNYLDPKALLDKMSINAKKLRKFLVLRMYWRNPKKIFSLFNSSPKKP